MFPIVSYDFPIIREVGMSVTLQNQLCLSLDPPNYFKKYKRTWNHVWKYDFYKYEKVWMSEISDVVEQNWKSRAPEHDGHHEYGTNIYLKTWNGSLAITVNKLRSCQHFEISEPFNFQKCSKFETLKFLDFWKLST